MPRKKLHSYHASLLRVGEAYQGGYVLPPNMDTEVDTEIRCPHDTSKKLKIPVCRLLTNNQFGGEHLLFHGTCDPDESAFPTAHNFRWYAFDSNMSLDFIKEEMHHRRMSKDKLPIGTPTLYVYRMKAPIRNLLLFADIQSWQALGGHMALLQHGICGYRPPPVESPEGQRLAASARKLRAPLPELAMANGIRDFKVLRGTRGEACNGWVRLNAAGILGRKMIITKGFELLLTHDRHEDVLELVDTFEVVDDPHRYGRVDTVYQNMDVMDWVWSKLPAEEAPPPPSRRRESYPPPPPPKRTQRRSVG